jgi:hypothetical protein
MTELKLLAAALIATAMLAAPAMARESYVTSRHLAGNANASNTPGARYIGGGDGFRGDHSSGGFGGTPGDGYGGRDVWGHWGTTMDPWFRRFELEQSQERTYCHEDRRDQIQRETQQRSADHHWA